jgi:hypothetical protein
MSVKVSLFDLPGFLSIHQYDNGLNNNVSLELAFHGQRQEQSSEIRDIASSWRMAIAVLKGYQ